MYIITNDNDGTVVELTEKEANTKFGAAQFNEMLAGCESGVSVEDTSITDDDDFLDESMDGDFDSGMASAGFGTDEDYGYFGE